MKTKLFLGALTAALIIGAPITISVHRNAARAIDAPQSSRSEPLAQPTIPEKPVTDIPQNTSDTTTAPAPVIQPSQEQTTPDVSTPAATPQPCTIETPIDTMCITAEGHLGRAVGQSANGFYMVLVNGSDNPNVTMPDGFNYQIEIIGN